MENPTVHLDPELLSAYLDEEVTPQERVVVEAHLKSCAQCQSDLEGLRWTVGLLARLPEAPLPRAFYLTEADVGRDGSRTTRQSWLDWLQPLLSWATAVSALVFVVLLGSLSVSTLGSGQAAQPMAPAARQHVEAEREVNQPPGPRAAGADAAGVANEPEATVAVAIEAESEVFTTAPAEGVARMQPPVAAGEVAEAPPAPAPVPGEEGGNTAAEDAIPPVPGVESATLVPEVMSQAPPAAAEPTPATQEDTATLMSEAQKSAPDDTSLRDDQGDPPPVEGREVPIQPWRPGLGTLTLFFGVLTAVLGGAMLWLRRRA